MKTKYDFDKSGLEKKISDMDKKIPDTSSLVKKTDFDAKITEVKSKLPSTSGLATSSALTAVENKIPNVINLVKNTDYNTKISDIEKKITDHNHDKYITTPEFNRLTTENFKARLAQANLITKRDHSNKSKHLLDENELKKTKTFDSSYFRGKDYLEENYLIIKPMSQYFKKIANTKRILSWKSRGLSDDVIKSPNINNNILATKLEYINKRMFVKFN